MDVLSKQIIFGIVWRYAEKFGNQLVQFGVSVVLARILLPSDFGTVALNAFFLVIATLLTESGFGSAIIQKKEVDQLDLATVFYSNLTIAAVMYGLLFVAAPYIAEFYNSPIVAPLLRVQALILIFYASNGVHTALLSRRMLFKKSFKITFTATIINGVVGVSMALSGYGLWSLVFSQLASAFLTTVMYWLMIGWRPTWEFSWKRLREMFGFSSRFMSVGLLTAVYGNILSVVIGKRYSSTQLGYYNRGQALPALAIDNLANSLGQVLLPALSSCQDRNDLIISRFRQAIVYSSYGIFFVLTMLIVLAKPLILFLYGETWAPSVPFLQIVCVGYFFYAINQVNQITVCSVGRSDLHLNYDLIKKGVMTAILLASIPFGIYQMVWGYSISMIISACISTIPTGRVIGYGLFRQIRDIGPALIAALVAGFCAFLLADVVVSNILCLLIQFSAGAMVYLVLSFMLKLDGILLIIGFLPRIRNLYGK